MASGAALAWLSQHGQSRADMAWHEMPVIYAPGGSSATRRSSISRLSFPALTQKFYVYSGDPEANLLFGPVHVEGSAEPGEQGNCIIAGHRDTHFRVLSEIKVGDTINIEHDGAKSTYVVESLKVVRAKDDSFYRRTAQPVLTLVTCYPFYYVGPAPKRFIVRARLVNS